MWGWNADYPDPENFLFLLYSKNSKVKYSGENATNYANVEFDALFEKMKLMPNSPERQKIIDQMIELLQKDSPWLAGFYPKQFTLRHGWVNPLKSNTMSRNTLKYISIKPPLRARLRALWNPPEPQPLVIGLGLFLLLCIPAGIIYWRRMYQKPILSHSKKLKD
jgi:hypothetical protein